MPKLLLNFPVHPNIFLKPLPQKISGYGPVYVSEGMASTS